jgi:tungstate transport system substrate-binding protein
VGVCLGLALTACGGELPPENAAASPERGVIVAATTSLEDTGLMPELVRRFHAETPWRLKTLSVPSGEALGLIRRGAADVAITNAPVEEHEAEESGEACCRTLVMQNDFVIVGPPDTPPFPDGLEPPEAMRLIGARELPFISRGDESGTHEFELGLWEQAGVEPAGEHYLETGQGMGATLRIASEKAALTVSDRGTYTAARPNLDLEIVYASPKAMPAPYSMLRANSGERLNSEGAEAFGRWLLDPETQRFIGAFAIGGERLFRPAVTGR